ncbi:MAG TPA: energy transducer TonB [Candidatus Acidoferrales bacterium]|nr:energy transducer TonB [Candidatus Acidoferrales bacterium]
MRILFGAFLLVNLVCCPAPVIQAQDETDAQKHMRANEISAVRSLRTINAACVTYSATYGIGYPSALGYLRASGPPSRTAASLIDDALAAGEKDGYRFTYTPGTPFAGTVPAYIVRADPVGPGETGRRHFFTDPSGVIRWNDSAPAEETDPPIDELNDYKRERLRESKPGGEVEINDEKAVDSLRIINAACIAFAAAYGAGFPAELRELGPSQTTYVHAANLIDEILANGTKNGYVFVYNPGKPYQGVVATYTITADPAEPIQTGHWHFFTDQSGVVRGNAMATASASDPEVPRKSDLGFGAAGAPSSAGTTGPHRIRVSAAVTQAKLVKRVAPIYPPLARQAKITGTVHLRAIISTDGKIASLEVISGPPLLIQSALDAVRQWEYKPTLLLGEPVIVETFIDVQYALGNPSNPGAPSDTNPKPE